MNVNKFDIQHNVIEVLTYFSLFSFSFIKSETHYTVSMHFFVVKCHDFISLNLVVSCRYVYILRYCFLILCHGVMSSERVRGNGRGRVKMGEDE